LSFYGDGASDIIKFIEKESKENRNISFYGAFKNPDDLGRIYMQNNLNFVAYNNQLENELVAMPNKFYESGYFNIPLVCSRNTYVAERVINMGMGWVIEPTMCGIETFFSELTIKKIVDCHQKIKEIDKSNFAY
jgi:hypothetical protein